MRVLVKVEWKAEGENQKPDLSFLPPLERRRLTTIERAALSVAWQALHSSEANISEGEKIPIVFASRWGEIGTTFKLMNQVASEGEMSPAGFANSVHNATPGHISLITKNIASYTAIAAGEKSEEMGLLEASLYTGKVLFVYAEEATPEFYRSTHPDCQETYAKALVIDNSL